MYMCVNIYTYIYIRACTHAHTPTHLSLLDDGGGEVVVRYAQGLHVGDEGPGVEGGGLRVDGGGGDGEADGGAFLLFVG